MPIKEAIKVHWIQDSDKKLTIICLSEYLRLVEEGKTSWEEGFANAYLKPLIERIKDLEGEAHSSTG
jgi:hypothetical protein